MYRIVIIPMLLCTFIRFARSDARNENDVFTCNPTKNFDDKVNALIGQKMADYDDMVSDIKRLREFRSASEDKIQNLESEVKQIKDRLRVLEEKTGTTLTDCPNSGRSGVYTVFGLAYRQGLKVYCDTETDGGGWTIFQLRKNGIVDFDRNWSDYVNGFGSLDEEFWLGLKPLRMILDTGDFELRVDMQDWEGKNVFATYSNFALSGEDSDFAITVSEYKGTAGDALGPHNGSKFSTRDSDNDHNINGNCAKDLKGGWWFDNCNLSHLNGKYYNGGTYAPKQGSPVDGISWFYWKNTKLYSMKETTMKIRKKK